MPGEFAQECISSKGHQELACVGMTSGPFAWANRRCRTPAGALYVRMVLRLG